jgi:hypothetical protein
VQLPAAELRTAGRDHTGDGLHRPVPLPLCARSTASPTPCAAPATATSSICSGSSRPCNRSPRKACPCAFSASRRSFGRPCSICRPHGVPELKLPADSLVFFGGGWKTQQPARKSPDSNCMGASPGNSASRYVALPRRLRRGRARGALHRMCPPSFSCARLRQGVRAQSAGLLRTALRPARLAGVRLALHFVQPGARRGDERSGDAAPRLRAVAAASPVTGSNCMAARAPRPAEAARWPRPNYWGGTDMYLINGELHADVDLDNALGAAASDLAATPQHAAGQRHRTDRRRHTLPSTSAQRRAAAG